MKNHAVIRNWITVNDNAEATDQKNDNSYQLSTVFRLKYRAVPSSVSGMQTDPSVVYQRLAYRWRENKLMSTKFKNKKGWLTYISFWQVLRLFMERMSGEINLWRLKGRMPTLTQSIGWISDSYEPEERFLTFPLCVWQVTSPP